MYMYILCVGHLMRKLVMLTLKDKNYLNIKAQYN